MNDMVGGVRAGIAMTFVPQTLPPFPTAEPAVERGAGCSVQRL